MWVTKDNEIISDAEPDSDGFMEVRRPCPDCLGSGINCLQCAGSGSLPAVMEKVYPVYEWASKNSLQMPFKSPEQALIKSFLKVILEAPNQGKSNFYSALIPKLDKSYFPTKLQFRCLKPNGYRKSSAVSLQVRPFTAKIGTKLYLALTVIKIQVLTRKCSSESFSSLLLETSDHRHFIAYDTHPSGFILGNIINCNVQVVKRLWVNNMSILLVKMISSSLIK
ncbi:Uncharacterised protein [Klebsiella pneumoniae]|uniref:Uncharacterized protein n=2 Tax=Klebsiella pneumoniae complex TaxID=3390273 RepID=A0AAW9PS04_KLEVA|nr:MULTISPECIES: hypothetical protein [Klebsiella]MDU7379812.1 hypothetical protein [Enterobacteriaceae bacterium]HCA9798328.1 hypothetical protein [Klebsiella variicola subsp. variicola]EIW8532391.1 hypothetical protein [Klebsiella pneumoniae]EKZ6803990.1 hypothetical protein [Klebsiella pneumoniae]KDL12569.1 hypothetical protein AF38_05122 [Klebsiella pneumoniae MGH 52]